MIESVRISEVIRVIEDYAPLHLQESYDNCGMQVGAEGDQECTGILLAVDPTPYVVKEAIERGCNLIITHHPLLFHGLKSVTGATPVEQAIIDAIRHGITIYSAHTSLDRCSGGVSAAMAQMLGLEDIHPLERTDSPDIGLGAIGELREPCTCTEFISLVKSTFGSPVVRHTSLSPDKLIKTVALCGGSGASLMTDAIRSGADAMITSDTRYHDFVDYADSILIADIGHFEGEKCTKSIFHKVITENFPNFANLYLATEPNPINYM